MNAASFENSQFALKKLLMSYKTNKSIKNMVKPHLSETDLFKLASQCDQTSIQHT